MAVRHASTIKRARQDVKRNRRNRATLSSVKSLAKKVLSEADSNKLDAAQASLREATAALHKAVAKGILKRNTASRRISKLAIKVNALKTAQS
jgi:small subunit ribosomal protein S20